MRASGFSFIYPMLMSLTVFAGSVEFVAVNLLLGSILSGSGTCCYIDLMRVIFFNGFQCLISIKGRGWKKFYLIFGMCDESFSINYTAFNT